MFQNSLPNAGEVRKKLKSYKLRVNTFLVIQSWYFSSNQNLPDTLESQLKEADDDFR